MVRTLAFRLISLAAVLMLAVASVGSAAHMAPGPADAPVVQAAWVLNGIDPGNICGDATGPHGNDHHCPFCRLLSDPPEVRISPSVQRLALGPAWTPFARDQRLGPQQDASSVSARGPPPRTLA